MEVDVGVEMEVDVVGVVCVVVEAIWVLLKKSKFIKFGKRIILYDL